MSELVAIDTIQVFSIEGNDIIHIGNIGDVTVQSALDHGETFHVFYMDGMGDEGDIILNAFDTVTLMDYENEEVFI
jgi:hypothetical protein